MNNKNFISHIINNLNIRLNSPLLYKDDKLQLTYQELLEAISKRPNFDQLDQIKQSDKPYTFLKWTENNKEFICRYFQLINFGIIPILVDERRLQNSPGDYDIEDVFESFQKNQIHIIEKYEDCATILYTSGSTGTPKGVRISLKNLISSAKATIEHYQITSEDNWALSLPLYHIGGLMILWRCLMAGASTTLSRPDNVQETIINSKKVTMASLVQLQLERIVNIASMDDFKKLKGVVLGGSKVDPTLMKKAISKNLKLSNSYGATESCAQFLATPFTNDLQTLMSVGSPMNGHVFIENDHLILEGDSIALGYLNGESFNSRLMTNDKATYDANNNITIIGRSDNTFQKAAENINPENIEAKINVGLETNCYVVPIDNNRYENLISLIFDKRETLKKVNKIINDSLIPFERPHLIYQCDDISSYQKGIKISRKQIASTLNELHDGFSEKLYLNACGRPSGDILIISHGFMGEALEFENLIQDLKEKYLIIFIDLPGHGSNCKLESLEEFKNEIINFIKNANNEDRKINFLTYSMSARIFQEILFDKRLSKIQNIDNFINESGSPGFLTDEDSRKKRMAHDGRIFDTYNSNQDAREFFKNWYEQSVFTKVNEHSEYQNMIETKSAQLPSMITYWQKAATTLSVANQENLLDITRLPKGIKYHYIHGRLDTKYSQYAQQLKAHGAFTYEIADASHNTHLMSPKDYLKVLHKILK